MKNYKFIKLRDEDIGEGLSAGRGDYDGIAMLGLITSVVSAPVAFGCTVARAVKSKKIQKETLSTEKVAEYNKSIEKLDTAAAVTSGISCVGLVTMICGAYASNSYNPPKGKPGYMDFVNK